MSWLRWFFIREGLKFLGVWAAAYLYTAWTSWSWNPFAMVDLSDPTDRILVTCYLVFAAGTVIVVVALLWAVHRVIKRIPIPPEGDAENKP